MIGKILAVCFILTISASGITGEEPCPGPDESTVLMWDFNEGNITDGTVMDLSGNGNNGNATDPAVGWKPGRYREQNKNDQAADFGPSFIKNGIFARPAIFCKDDPNLRPKKALTLECWINLKARPFESKSKYNTLMAKSELNIWDFTPIYNTLSYYLGFLESSERADNLVFILNDGNKYYRLASDTKEIVKPGEWHHIAATYDGEAMNIFVDSKCQATLKTGPFSIKENGNNFWIGMYSNALIDCVKVSLIARKF